ncbi:hypothetical protein BGX28_003470 [Mortierella sp. GBA30]|nr:hypothetical protein BGX28_003470 [Mortierella sp. GBA30]
MTRQRSMSTSSLVTLVKSPTSLTASLSASVAVYDNHQPPKTLQDILLLAQSHYISHRYVPALTLYRLAAERHHSLPACCSLYALYTSTLKAPGLIRSDTKAAEVLIHALRIWTARRWSTSFSVLESNTSMRSKTRDEYAELEEYFAQPRSAGGKAKRFRRSSNSSGGSIPVALAAPRGSSSSNGCLPPSRVVDRISGSVESEYRHPQFSNHESESEGEEDEGEEDHDCEECESCDDDDACEDCDDSYEVDDEDEEHAKEEEARRIGLATIEIEDIVQKLCLLIQKGVLGLDEAVIIEAITMIRKIERGLSKDAEAWQAELAKSKSVFGSSVGKREGEDESQSSMGQAPNLLLTQSIDLSFLNLTPENDSPVAKAQSVDVSSRRRQQRPQSIPSNGSSISMPSKDSAVNAAISRLSTGEQEADQAVCRAIRIRVMFTLGWVHQQKGEYHWGAQAYGVCSDITAPTGKRLLLMLQQQAVVQKRACLALQEKGQEQQQQQEEAIALEKQRLEEATILQHRPDRIPSPPSQEICLTQQHQATSCTSSSFTSIEVSTEAQHRQHHQADISTPSSYSSSESAAVSIRGGHAGGAISSLSAAIRSSGLFKSSYSSSSTSSSSEAWTKATFVTSSQPSSARSPSVQSDPTSKSSTRRLYRSKSISAGLKITTLKSDVDDVATSAVAAPEQGPKEKEPHHRHQHHHPRAQHRSKGHHHHHHQHSTQAAPMTMTMSDHQKKVVKCGHCGQKRVLMPLCVCKTVRYCNRDCRLADLENHSETGCHAALMSISSGPKGLVVDPVHSAVGSGVTL